MKKFVFIFCMACLTAAPAMSSKQDTLRVYNINGQPYRKFSGKELVGKTIKSYDILYDSQSGSKKVIESHRIKTTTPPPSSNNSEPQYTIISNSEPHYIIEGKKGEISKEDMHKIPASKIASISVLKPGSKAIIEHSLKDDGRAYIIIKLKE